MQQEDAFGFLSDKEEMEKLVFFFRFHLFGTCYLTAVCILASYLGQMAFELDRVLCPPDVGKLIRSFKDVDLYNHIVKDAGGDSNKVLTDMLERLGKPGCRLQVDTEGSFEAAFDLKARFSFFGPGLVTTFNCTTEFHMAYKRNPEWQTKRSGSKNDEVAVGFMQFDMQDGQAVEAVQGVWKELKAPRGTNIKTEDEINLRLEAADEKTKTKLSWFDPPSGTMVGSPNVGGGGDRSAHVYSPQSSPDSIESSPRHDRTAISHDNADLDDIRDLDEESIDALGDGESSQSQVRDRPPAVKRDEDDDQESRHAMVCIGGRVDKNKKTFLFLQNSWSRMPLVEVSLNYFIAVGGTLSFVTKRDRELFKKLAEKASKSRATRTRGSRVGQPETHTPDTDTLPQS